MDTMWTGRQVMHALFPARPTTIILLETIMLIELCYLA